MKAEGQGGGRAQAGGRESKGQGPEGDSLGEEVQPFQNILGVWLREIRWWADPSPPRLPGLVWPLEGQGPQG